MNRIFTFPEILEPEDCLFPVKLRTDSPANKKPLSPGDAFIASARTSEDLEPLARVLSKNPELRKAIYLGLKEEGALEGYSVEL